MNVWQRSGVSLIAIPELARAAALSHERIERCAYVLRAMLDSARRIDLHGAYALDVHDIAFTLSCSPRSIEAIAEGFARPEVALVEGGAIARWREWAVERTLSTIFD
jgi:hypothetical protein